jgi:4-hydroxy-tetrahydrodipicolinate synthase
MKYYQWVMGGNGGLLPLDGREKVPVLDAAARRLIRDTCRQAGIQVDRPEEEFMVGRVAYAKGVRPSNLASKPLYT